MKIGGLFSILFLLFWAIPFPMLMYYNLSVFSDGSSPQMALVWLAVALLLSGLLLWTLFKRLILVRYIAINNLNNLMQNGDVKSAKIIQSTPLTPEFAGINKYQLTLELQNFVGTTIRETMNLNDSKPELHSFDTGKTIKLRIDKTLKNVPYIQLDGAHYNKATPRGLILGGLLWVYSCVYHRWLLCL